MSYEVKDMLEIAIANNDSLWEVEVIDSLHGELDRLYSQEAKAKAFDAVLKSYEESISEGHMADDVCKIVYKYGRGGYDD